MLQDFPESPRRRSPQRTRSLQADDDLPDGAGKSELDSISVHGLQRQGSLEYTFEEERLVLRKFDRHLVLFIALLYMLAFLDRSNIGNAKIAGLSDDLDLESSQYEWTLRSFYITYILFEWMPILYTVLTPSTYIASCVAVWGIIASLQALATSYVSLCILRALLGISEAAFSPGVPVFLATFYKRDELAYRIGLFISAAPLATSFASSLAWLITKLGQQSPIAAWRMLFIVEGFPSVIISVFAFYYIADTPGAAKYLTKRERKVAELRLRQGKTKEQHETSGKRFKWNEIYEALKDPKCYLTATMFCSCNVAFSSLPVFLPTIIEEYVHPIAPSDLLHNLILIECFTSHTDGPFLLTKRSMGYSALRSQALSAPPYLIAFVVVLVTAYYSDKYKNRSLFVCFHALLAAGGYAMITIAGIFKASAMWRYWGVYPAASGFFSAVTLLITWTINNQDSDAKKGTGVAILNIIGQLGPFIGTALYPETDSPYYIRGMAACTIFMLMVAGLSLLLRTILQNQKTVRDTPYIVIQGGGEEDGLVDADRKWVDRPISFRYVL